MRRPASPSGGSPWRERCAMCPLLNFNWPRVRPSEVASGAVSQSGPCSFDWLPWPRLADGPLLASLAPGRVPAWGLLLIPLQGGPGNPPVPRLAPKLQGLMRCWLAGALAPQGESPTGDSDAAA